MNRRRWSVVSCVTISAALSLWAAWSSLPTGRGPVPLHRSSFLRDVVEPITIVNAMSFDDGGSQGLRFKDARGVLKDVCLEDTRVWEDDPVALEGHHNIILNSFFPRGEGAQRVPVSGVEERALLGLLDRWARQDPNAMTLEQRHELHERGQIDLDDFWKGLSGEHRVKGIAVSILRELRSRN